MTSSHPNSPTTHPALTSRVYGDWEWDEATKRPKNIYPAQITGTWSGGVEFRTDRPTAERIVAAQTALRGSSDFPEDIEILSWDDDAVLLTDVEGNSHRHEPDDDGLYHLSFGWTWGEWTDEAEQEHPDPDNATRCDDCGALMWLGLDVLRRSQEGEDFYCEDCTEKRSQPEAVVVAYAVHVEGALWDDPQISAWTESIYNAATMMEKAEAFFAEDDDGVPGGVPLLTIVRAEFTPDEWQTVKANDWAA